MVNPLYSILGVLFKSSGSILQIVTTLKYWKFWLPIIIILTSFALEFGFLIIECTETGDYIPIAKELGRKTFAIDNKMLLDTQKLVTYPVLSLGFFVTMYQVFSDFIMVWLLVMISYKIAHTFFGNTNSPIIIYVVVFGILLFFGMLEVIYVKLFDDSWVIPLGGILESIGILFSTYLLPHIQKPV